MRLRDDKRAVLLHEQDVGATGLLDIGAGLGVEIQVLGIALAVSFHRGLKGHGVVEASLDVAGAVRCGAVVLGNAQLDRLEATLKVRTDRGHENAERVLRSGSHADHVTGADHKRTHIQGCARAEGRNPCGVGRDDLLDCLNELVLGERGHLEALSGVVHTLGVHVGTEADDAAVLGGVGLQALKDLLAVMEDAAALGDMQGVVGGQAALVPLAILPMGLVAVIGLHVAKAEATPIDILLLDSHMSLLTYTVAYSRTRTQGPKPAASQRRIPGSVEPGRTRGQHRSRWHVDSHAGDCTPRTPWIKRFSLTK